MSAPPDFRVCVTGATGFVASWLVRELLERGVTVRGTVRRVAGADHLRALPGATDHLELVEADLTAPGSFEPAVRGCAAVFHTASPYVIQVDDPQRDLVDPAVNGTLDVLRACAAAADVARVVLTSSMAAVTDEPDAAGAHRGRLEREVHAAAQPLLPVEDAGGARGMELHGAGAPALRSGGAQPVHDHGTVARARPQRVEQDHRGPGQRRVPRHPQPHLGHRGRARRGARARARRRGPCRARPLPARAGAAGQHADPGRLAARGRLRRGHEAAVTGDGQRPRQPAREAERVLPAPRRRQLPADAHRPRAPLRFLEGAAGAGADAAADARDGARHRPRSRAPRAHRAAPRGGRRAADILFAL